MLAFVADIRNKRIGNGINNMTCGFDEADDSEHTEHHDALRDECRQPRSCGRLIEIDQIIIEHRCEQTDRKLRQCVTQDDLTGYFFHRFSPLFYFFPILYTLFPAFARGILTILQKNVKIIATESHDCVSRRWHGRTQRTCAVLRKSGANPEQQPLP